MLMAAISSFALVLAVGPQVQLGLQVALEQNPPANAAQSSDPVETDDVTTGLIVESTPSAPELIEDDFDEVVIEATDDAGAREAPILVDTAPQETRPAPTDSEPIDNAPSENVPTSQPEPPVQPQSGEMPEAEWASVLDEASAALAAAKTAKGNFVQTNPDGSIVTGTFALNRPGRMRFDYDDPTPVLIVSDGTTVAMEDSELETVDRVPIGATPLGLILSTDLSVGEDVDVLSVLQNQDRIGIRVQDASGELEGSLTMVFDKVSFDLLGWMAADGNFQTTVVDLTDVETNVRVDPRLFRLDEAEDEEEER